MEMRIAAIPMTMQYLTRIHRVAQREWVGMNREFSGLAVVEQSSLRCCKLDCVRRLSPYHASASSEKSEIAMQINAIMLKRVLERARRMLPQAVRT